ncbi:hypothetical protein HN446_00865 [bacterium]|jgi:hypothetical protein|nr:hypothetical protein [bacterium]
MKRCIVKAFTLAILFLYSFTTIAEEKTSQEIFGKWQRTQRVFDYVNISKQKYLFSHKNFKSKEPAGPYEKLEQLLYKPSSFDLIEYNLDDLIEQIKNIKEFASEETNKKELSNDVLEHYSVIFDIGSTKIGQMVFNKTNFYERKRQFIFNIANKISQYCFNPSTNKSFRVLLNNNKYHPIVRMLYAIMWKHFSGIGWCNWSQECLSNIKKMAKQKHETVYIAGGSDIYQLLINGIYNIRVIDPQLKTQPTYYSEGWSFLINGSIGDTIKIPEADIILTRISKTKTGKIFKAPVSRTEKESIPEETIVWKISNIQNPKKELGILTFERRFAIQKDFDFSPQKTIVLSFNELYFIATPENFEGWEINPDKFDKNIQLYIKQLHQPFNKKMVLNLTDSERSQFRFIKLGSNTVFAPEH